MAKRKVIPSSTPPSTKAKSKTPTRVKRKNIKVGDTVTVLWSDHFIPSDEHVEPEEAAEHKALIYKTSGLYIGENKETLTIAQSKDEAETHGEQPLVILKKNILRLTLNPEDAQIELEIFC